MSEEEKADPTRFGVAGRQRVAQASGCSVAQVPYLCNDAGSTVLQRLTAAAAAYDAAL